MNFFDDESKIIEWLQSVKVNKVLLLNDSVVLLKQMMIFVMIIYINTYRHNIIIYDLFHLVTAQEVD